MASSNALVLFSGGQDSTVCLAWALTRFERVETIGFSYGQRHAIELQCRPRIRALLPALGADWTERLGDDHVIDLSVLGDVSDTALTRETEITMLESGLPSTFVPGRNLVFLVFAAAVAYRRGLASLVIGASQADFSGYPDCREGTIRSMATTLGLGLDRDMPIETPLMHIDKAATWRLARSLGGRELVDLIVEETHTCYFGERGLRHDWGYGCGSCPACDLRAKGWVSYAAGGGAA
ncbi:7-cyano-7-deazaguanine synthase QueC [bacterium]|nr:7-cyano-7-deazaguanine synthase QueC [bacterium]